MLRYISGKESKGGPEVPEGHGGEELNIAFIPFVRLRFGRREL